MQSHLSFSLSAFSHIGHREENQDRYCILEDPHTNSLLIVVADGMGGHEGGALAAQTIIDTASRCWSERDNSQPAEEFLQFLTSQSHTAVVAAGDKSKLDPRSTLAALLISQSLTGSVAVSIHAGDCRILQFKSSEFVSGTLDHSVAQLKVLRGKIEQDDVATDPDQNKVITSIGGDENPEAEITNWDLEKGEQFVVCSDGFWELFSNADISDLLSRESGDNDDDETLEELLEQTFLSKLRKEEKHDNSTVVMITPSRDTPSATTVENLTAQKTSTSVSSSWAFPLLAIAAVVVLLAYLLLPTSDSESTTELAQGSGTEQAGGVSGSESSGDDSSAEQTETSTSVDDEPTSTAGGEQRGEQSQASDGDLFDSIDIELNVEVAGDSELVDVVTEILQDSGALGEDDSLEIDRSGAIDGTRVLRLSQEYQGIPVYGAEVIVLEGDGSVGRVSGQTGSGIAVDINPGLNFEDALASASASAGIEFDTEEIGNLIVYSSTDEYLLAWIALVNPENSIAEQLVLDANSGAILARFPISVGEQR